MQYKIIKENGNLHLEGSDKNQTIKFSLFKHENNYEFIARRSSHSIYNFVQLKVDQNDEIAILKDFFKIGYDILNKNKVDCIPILKDDTIEDKL